jgi:hypothetical protein
LIRRGEIAVNQTALSSEQWPVYDNAATQILNQIGLRHRTHFDE